MKTHRLAEALGASEVVRLPRKPKGPADALALMRSIHSRLRPGSGKRRGRPSNPNWTLRRQVPFSEDTWSRLHDYAEAFSTPERRVSPAQVAAAILDEVLAEQNAGGKSAPPEVEG